jgi:hypothetical protein
MFTEEYLRQILSQHKLLEKSCFVRYCLPFAGFDETWSQEQHKSLSLTQCISGSSFSFWTNETNIASAGHYALGGYQSV